MVLWHFPWFADAQYFVLLLLLLSDAHKLLLPKEVLM
jgi:hypothetical protein